MAKEQSYDVEVVYADDDSCFYTVTARSMHTAIVKAAERLPLTRDVVEFHVTSSDIEKVGS